MSESAYFRPHSVDHGRNEKCAGCGIRLTSWCTEPDPCIGYLPGVYNACCGHGEDDEAYITFGFKKYEHTNMAQGLEALEIITAMRQALGDLDDERWHGGHDDPDASFEEIFGEQV